MIPLGLNLRNFMCYRDEVPVDLRGIHLACLAGDNGAGKSALLDAMTWALWGKARARFDDDLIHLGQTEMEVQFDFLLGDDRYRVIRQRSSKGRGRSVLELQVEDGDDFRALTESTIRDTQARIVGMLRMDYDTFINSAFLLQGRADEFTTKPPGQRKEILGQILGLGAYDELQDQARKRAREAEQRRAALAASIAEIETELAHEDRYRQEVHDAEQHVEDVHTRLRDAEADLRQARAAVQALEAKEAQARDLETRIARAEDELKRLAGQVNEHQERIAGYERLLGEAEAIEAGYAEWQAARQADEAFNRKLAESLVLTEETSALRQTVAGERQRLAFEAETAHKRIAELEPRANQVDRWREELTTVQARLDTLTVQAQACDADRADLERLTAELAALQAENERLKDDMTDLRDRVDALRTAEAEAGLAHCPLCESELHADALETLVARLTAEGNALGDAYRANQARRKDLRDRVDALRERIAEAEKALQTESGLQRQAASLEHALTDAEAAAVELAAARESLVETEHRLAAQEFLPAEQARLVELEAQAAALGYDEAAHQKAQDRVAELAEFEGREAQLDAARERVASDRETLARLVESRSRWREGLDEDRARHQELTADLADLPVQRAQAEEQAGVVAGLQQAEAEARLALGAARQRLEHCKVLRRQREEKASQEQAAAEEKDIYDDLALAFGKKGIQAMIIEAAIPEIEAEANRLLARMTDGRMHVTFETQRETKKGDTLETLDIAIADEVGTRPYENYSGGEQFRANFAIRVALSKLLARRAGAQLQTLVVDEGFGTQDSQGRSRLVEAINAVSNDFGFILVITHIEELQDTFPVRIDVVKTGEGSQVSVN